MRLSEYGKDDLSQRSELINSITFVEKQHTIQIQICIPEKTVFFVWKNMNTIIDKISNKFNLIVKLKLIIITLIDMRLISMFAD